MDQLEYKHEKIKSLGKIGKDEGFLFVHYLTDGETLRFIIATIEWGFNERDFKTIDDAYSWLIERQRLQKRHERQKKNEYQRSRYWKKHTTFM